MNKLMESVFVILIPMLMQLKDLDVTFLAMINSTEITLSDPVNLVCPLAKPAIHQIHVPPVMNPPIPSIQESTDVSVWQPILSLTQ
jgi:hypothetical protein